MVTKSFRLKTGPFYLNKKTEIPWPVLELQFGSDYSRTIDFKRKFLNTLRKVTLVYTDANVEIGAKGLILNPSKKCIFS